MKYGMVINLNRCIGCQTCVISCKMSNNIPMNMLWNRVISNDEEVYDGAEGEYPNLYRSYTPIACQHCENPACLSVCPVSATYKDDESRVQIDYSKCIGCRMCMAACPYNARVFNWGDPVRDPDFNYGHKDVPVRAKGVAEKCTLCKERVSEGNEPMCVSSCLGHARFFGDLDDPESQVSQLVKDRGAIQLLPECGTNPQVYYLV